MTTLVPKFQRPGTGAVNRAFNLKLNDYVSVTDFGAVGDGTTDNTTAFNNAIATGREVYVPAGTYLINATINNKTVIYGDGNTISIVMPYNTAIAAMTYTYAAMQTPSPGFWTYHSEIHNLGFENSAMVGVGFTFGTTVPANYTTNMELATNVKFYGCHFSGLDKGVQFPFGNIGSEFYSCGFYANKYGVYTINAKFGGTMQAGNKYFFAGEFHSNTCAYYYNDTINSGNTTFNSTIFESNNIALYFYNALYMITPIAFENVWFENNGSQFSATPVVIDSWSGSTLTTQTVTPKTVIIDGQQGQYMFTNSFFGDVYVKATNAQVIATNCRAERSTGFNGGECIVDNSSSNIRLINPTFNGGLPAGTNITTSGFVYNTNAVSSSSTAGSLRWFTATPRIKQSTYGTSLAAGVKFTSAETTSGSYTLTGSVVSDGQIYSSCNQFSQATFGATQYCQIVNSYYVVANAGWYVFTFDAQVTQGVPNFFVWNRSTAQFAINMTCPVLNRWYTFAGMGQFTSAGAALYLDVAGDGGTCTWKMSAYQMHYFTTFTAAQAFLASEVYAE